MGGADHGVSCLNYGDSTVSAAQGRTLSDAEIARGQPALNDARTLVDQWAFAGILGVAMGKSSDRAGEAAMIVYVSGRPNVPATVDNVRTMVIAANAEQVAMGTAPLAKFEAQPAPAAAELKRVMDVKERVGRMMIRQIPAFFGVGVGQSLDDPREAALVVYVDRHNTPASLPPMIDGVRARYVEMDRLHVTRSYSNVAPGTQHCVPHASAEQDVEEMMRPRISF